MNNTYRKLISETRDKIREIRCNSLRQVEEVQNHALAQVEQDFALLGWDKKWTSEQLFAEGQFERMEQSVMDSNLNLVKVNEKSKTGIIDDRIAYCKVSGAGCSCADFIYRGLPCKHMYYLAGALVGLHNQETPEGSS